jgi:hypothetical protein
MMHHATYRINGFNYLKKKYENLVYNLILSFNYSRSKFVIQRHIF